MLDDAQKELISAFVEESKEIVDGLSPIVEELENGSTAPDNFAVFAQRVDAIMGCAKTLGLDGMPSITGALSNIAKLGEVCKYVGYQATQVKEPALMSVIAAFLVEALELISDSLRDLEKGYMSVDIEAVKRIQERLKWIDSKLNLSADDKKAIQKRFGLS